MVDMTLIRPLNKKFKVIHFGTNHIRLPLWPSIVTFALGRTV